MPIQRRRKYSSDSSDSSYCSSSCSECSSDYTSSSQSSESSQSPPPSPKKPAQPAAELDISGANPVQTVKYLISRLPKLGGFSMAIASRRGSGKTVLVSELIRECLRKKLCDVAVVLSGSAGLNHDYEDVLPRQLIRPYSEDFLQRLWDKQAKIAQEDRPTILIVADDILSDKKTHRSEMLMKLYSQGRHCGFAVCLLSQSPTHVVSPIVRQNSDVLAWSALNHRSLSHLWESTTGISRNDFFDWADRNTGNYKFLCVDTGCLSAKPAEYLFVCRAKQPKK